LQILKSGIEKSKLGNSDKLKTLNKLHQIIESTEKILLPILIFRK
jgi:hypothetical protein